MNRVYIIIFELLRPARTSERIVRSIKSHGNWARLGGSAFLISTHLDPVQIREHLRQALDANDKLYVGAAPSPAAWIGLPDDVSRWIQANQG